METEKGASIRAIVRSISILQAINRSGALSLTQIAESADVPYPTANRIVRTLVEQGLIEREPSRKYYRPTALVQTLSCGFQNSDRFAAKARPHLVKLTRDIGWPVTISTRVGQVMVVRDSTSPLTSLTFNNYYPGWRVPLLDSASGQVYLAHAPVEEQQELLTYLEAGGAETVPIRSIELEKLLKQVRRQGYAAVSRTSYSANPGKTSSVAVPVFEHGVLQGSLALIFFARALSVQNALSRFLPRLKEVAEEIGQNMQADAAAAV